jgi:glycosyltransferase involved in cell wall biosynthesis
LDLLATRAARAHVCYVTRDLKERRGCAHAGLRTHVIANGVAGIERESCTRPAALCDQAFNLAIVGRLDKVKGHDLAIEALAARVMPENVHLYILGTGPCEHTLRNQANGYGISNRVHFLGFRRDVLDYIAHCDALIMPSLHEGLPYVLLEAMALETPVIASRVGGIAEILEDGITGLLIAPGDSSALVRAILRLNADRSLARRLAENARHLQRARFSLDAMTKRYVAVYREAAMPVRGGGQIRRERGATGH